MNNPKPLLATPDMSIMDGCTLGWADDPHGQVYDCRKWEPADALRNFAAEWGIDQKDATVRAAYARWLTEQEVWDDYGRERWEDEVDEHVACPKCGAAPEVPCEDEADLPLGIHQERLDAVPDTPPKDWEPDPENDPAWQTCKEDDPGAIRVLICEDGTR